MRLIPIKTEDLADAMQNRIHHEVGVSRPVKSLKTKRTEDARVSQHAKIIS